LTPSSFNSFLFLTMLILCICHNCRLFVIQILSQIYLRTSSSNHLLLLSKLKHCFFIHHYFLPIHFVITLSTRRMCWFLILMFFISITTIVTSNLRSSFCNLWSFWLGFKCCFSRFYFVVVEFLFSFLFPLLHFSFTFNLYLNY
jgi:hypothetical protein